MMGGVGYAVGQWPSLVYLMLAQSKVSHKISAIYDKLCENYHALSIMIFKDKLEVIRGGG